MQLRNRTSRLLALAVASGLVVAACGSDDEGTTATTEPAPVETAAPGTEPADTAATTEPVDTTATTEATDTTDTTEVVETTEPEVVEPASGEPITIGFVNMEDGPLAQPAVGEAAEAARQYVNETLGGVNGRPIEFDKCITNGAPESSAQCANQFVADQPVLVYQGLDFGNAAIHPILADAGIPWVGQEPFTPPDYQNGTSFSGSQVAYSLGAGIYLRDEVQPERITIMSYPSPTAAAAIETYIRPAMEASGATVEVVNVDYGAPDMSVPVAAALATNPDVIIFFMGDADCTKIVTAADQLSYEGMIIAGSCGSFVKDAGAAAEGVYALADVYSVDDLTQAPERSAAEVEAYVDAMAEYAPGRALDVITQFVFAGIVNLATVMNDIEGDVTPESVTAALDAAENVPSFMADTFTCAGELTALAPSICSANVLVLRAEGGKLVQLTPEFIYGPALFE